MTAPERQAATEALGPEEVRQALEQILRTERFQRAPRLSQFLRYVVERSQDPGDESLKEYAIAVDVFDRPTTFDPRVDTIVRVQARRLRERLAAYYAEEGRVQRVRIEIPSGGYAPRFRVVSGPARNDGESEGWLSWLGGDKGAVGYGVAGVVLAALGLVAAIGPPGESEVIARPLQARPLTTLGGQELQPDLSPDGEMAVFVWRDDASGKHDLYLKSIDGSALVQLTDAQGPEQSPAWSPDGETIAFLRSVERGSELVLIPAGGGAERRLANLNGKGEQISWSPDGRYVAAEDSGGPGEPAGIFLISTQTGRRIRLTSAWRAADHFPAFSPGGDMLAFARGSADHTIFVTAVDANGEAVGEPRQVSAGSHYVGGLDWTADGEEIVFGVFSEAEWWQLWNVDATQGPSQAEPLGLAGWQPALGMRAGGERRLVYAAHSEDMNLYRIPGPAASAESDRTPERIVASSRTDTAPSLSPDGERLAFASGRSGGFEIFVSAGDGSNPVQVTDFAGASAGSPRWSRDGRRIGFNADDHGHHDVYVIELAAGLPKRITTASSRDGGPSWSSGGGWLYFMSDRSGQPAIWKVPEGGGYPARVTAGRGYQAVESWDGRWLYFAKRFFGEGAAGIFRIPVEGGAEERVIETGELGKWALSRTSIYLLRPEADARPAAIERYRLESFVRETVMEFPAGTRFGIANNITVSADDRWIVYAQYDHAEADLMVTELGR